VRIALPAASVEFVDPVDNQRPLFTLAVAETIPTPDDISGYDPYVTEQQGVIFRAQLGRCSRAGAEP